ncbi:MAG: hypothetical protein GC160_16155 [Acidobacteria bacterium]|nr:hypothetical protein [Acidobacteriota bacterium]
MLRQLTVATLLSCSAALAADIPNAVFVLRNSQVAPAAFQTFLERIGPGACDCLLATDGHPELTADRIAAAQLLFLEHPSEALLDRLEEPVREGVARGLRVVTDVPSIVQRAWSFELSAPLALRLLPYWRAGGEQNMLGFFLAAYQEAGGSRQLEVAPPVEVPDTGVYHPDAPRLFPTMREYLSWYRAQKPGLGALAVVTFFPTYYLKGDLKFIDAVVVALEGEGLAAAAVAGWPLHELGPVLETPADDPIKVALSFTLAISKPEDAAFLEGLNVHVINLMTTEQSYAEWAEGDHGVTPSRVATSLGSPEPNGAVEPILVATAEPGADGGLDWTRPIDERVRMAAQRARRWVTLAEKPNWEKRLVILYYNNPPGKGNIGASYLNLAPSIRAVLDRLQAESYRVGQNLPTAGGILDQLERVGRNVEEWAPGELRRMVDEGGVTLLPMKTYQGWFEELPQKFRQSVNDRWGPPEASKLMVATSRDGEKLFVIPGVQFGNVFLGPQLLRASSAEYTSVQHSTTLPPHHGYVAAYLFYRHRFGADAVIHMGRHGTLEWLPGKNVGQAGWDASEAILGDLPNLNYYIMDGDGEAIQARRRGAAVDISHLTPMLALTGQQERFQALDDAFNGWRDSHADSPLLAAEYANTALREIERLDLGRQLDVENLPAEELMNQVHDFLESVEEAPIPLGLPTLGTLPSEERRRAGLLALLTNAFLAEELETVEPYLDAWRDAVFEGVAPTVPDSFDEGLREKVFRLFDEAHLWLDRLQESPGRELAALVEQLRGEFLPSGLVGDPLAVPDALPAGRNLHQGDPRMMPTPAGWEVGKRLAQQLLEKQLERDGKIPEHVSMILWMGESGRHQGAMEAQALYLMGVRPEWNARGYVDRLALIPEEQLGRPRVNVVFTVSGLYRDGMAEKIIQLDRAARLAAGAGDNALSRRNADVRERLIAEGVPEEEAEDLAGARVFTTAPGAYGFGISRFVEQSRDVEEPETMAELYLSKMNFAYTEKSWGRSAPKLLESHLRDNAAILHSRTSNLYGAVDNDDVYQWMGGLRVASESVGAKPRLYLNDLRKPGEERVEDARYAIARELNARNWNPQWISEMQKEGYSGAREMVKAVEYLYGWQATAPETISPTVWQKVYDVYVGDEYDLGLTEFFEESNPAGRQNLVARLLEVDRQGTYQFTDEQREVLVGEYVRLVSELGPACSGNTCGNRKLQEHVMREAQRLSQSRIAPEQLEDFSKEMARAFEPWPSPVKPAPANQTTRTPERGPSPRVNDMKITRVEMTAEEIRRLAHSARDFLADNLALLLICCVGSTVAGCVVAARMRRRRPLGDLHITKT